MATVTVLFDYQTGNVEAEMMELRREFDAVVESNFHTHVGDNFCLELFVLDGSLKVISTVVGLIRATKDVQTVNYSVLPMDDDTIDAE